MRIIFSVTNDLSYDQRMQRICHSLAINGYEVLLVGRSLPHSIPLKNQEYRQKRLNCFFRKGFVFYAEYNLRLFLFLLFLRRFDAVCSIDLDTLPAGFLATAFRRKKRVFDAHEYFSEVPEVVDRPFVKAFWEKLALWILPHYRFAYTVGPALAGIFEKLYGIKFEVIRNVPRQMPTGVGSPFESTGQPNIILYQGALNEGRGIEAAMAAVAHLEDVKLVIAGEGDLSEVLRARCRTMALEDKVKFLGYVTPEALKPLTSSAWLCLNLLENRGLSYYYSLANKFFDSVQAGVPVLTMDFPEYKTLNREYEVAVLLNDLSQTTIAEAIRGLLTDKAAYETLRQNCQEAKLEWNWENEEQILLRFWTALASA